MRSGKLNKAPAAKAEDSFNSAAATRAVIFTAKLPALNQKRLDAGN
jgi:hypothetical protein